MPLQPERIRAITLDLDDTLWPIWPTIERAEACLLDWFRARAPRVVDRFDLAATRALRAEVAHDWPDRAHDLSALRRESIRRMLVASGSDEALVEPAFEAFFAERQRVVLFDDALPALRRLAARWPLLALSNGNADLARTGVAGWFVGAVSAQQAGVGKPDARIFRVACERLGQDASNVLHVGDDPLLDVQGALDAGLQAAWIRRSEAAHADRRGRFWQGPDLLALADRLGA